MNVLFLAAPFYVIGWLLFVLLSRPENAAEGALFLTCGIIWPVFMLGWLVSRPYS